MDLNIKMYDKQNNFFQKIVKKQVRIAFLQWTVKYSFSFKIAIKNNTTTDKCYE